VQTAAPCAAVLLAAAALAAAPVPAARGPAPAGLTRGELVGVWVVTTTTPPYDPGDDPAVTAELVEFRADGTFVGFRWDDCVGTYCGRWDPDGWVMRFADVTTHYPDRPHTKVGDYTQTLRREGGGVLAERSPGGVRTEYRRLPGRRVVVADWF
jgi:hypothetical protein